MMTILFSKRPVYQNAASETFLASGQIARNYCLLLQPIQYKLKSSKKIQIRDVTQISIMLCYHVRLWKKTGWSIYTEYLLPQPIP